MDPRQAIGAKRFAAKGAMPACAAARPLHRHLGMKSTIAIGMLCGILLGSANWLGPVASLSAVTAAAEVSTEPAPPVVVRLAGGMRLFGDVAPRTNAAEFWLVRQRGPITVLRPIPWEQIAEVSVLGQSFSGDALQKIVRALRAEADVSLSRSP